MFCLENNNLKAVFDRLPFPDYIVYKKKNITIHGVDSNGILLVDGVAWPLCKVQCEWEGEKGKLIFTDGRELSISCCLLDQAVCLTIESVGTKPIKQIDGTNMPLLSVGPGFACFRDRFEYRNWYEDIGPGLARVRYENGPVLDYFPDSAPVQHVHGCFYKQDYCCYIFSNERYLPLMSQIQPHTKYPFRGGGLKLGFANATVTGKRTSALVLKICFCEDLNHDGLADECDYQLSLKQMLPDPNPLYKDTIWYKIFLGAQGYVETTYNQALSIIKKVHNLTGGAQQIVYLVGYQGEGHDSEYPGLDSLNPRLGSADSLLELIKKGREEYHAIVSLHINLDDAYQEHDGWDPDIISRNPDGSLFKWEIFNHKQAYHINHTVDVESGKVFERLDRLLQKVPIKDTIHIDAFRNTNFSWLPDRFIGPQDELYMGMMPILDHLRDRNIDPTTESYNGMTIEMIGLFSAVLHNSSLLPILCHNKLYGGGQGGNPVALVCGSSINSDYTNAELQPDNTRIADEIAERYLLYRYFNQREMIEFRTYKDRTEAYARFDDGTIATSDLSQDQLNVTTGSVLIADKDTRFIPLGHHIYAWHRTGGWIERDLPLSFIGQALKGYLINHQGCEIKGEWISQLSQNKIKLNLPPHAILDLTFDNEKTATSKIAAHNDQ
ncbi:MAG: hypothetical protein KBG64_00775 [Clostridia bacterium]|nr:hypothetical protein [Clostridia bacterium]